MSDFNGRIVLVTGGGKGVGGAISKAFAAHGAHVIVNYFHSRKEAEALVAALRADGGSVELLRGSVTDLDQVRAMFATIAERHGGLDVLVNNAGAGAMGPIDTILDHHWQQAWNTGLRGSLWCAREAAPLMERRGGGAIVSLSSLGGGQLVMRGFGACGATKAAMESLTRYLAVEYAPRGIRVNTAAFGVLESPAVELFPDAEPFMKQVAASTPLGRRLGRLDECAELVVFLASPAASWITGQCVLADGGLALGSMMLSPLMSPEPVPDPPREQPVGGAASSLREEPDVPVPEPDSPDPDGGAVIAVVGMGVVTPGANDPDELWEVLSGEKNVFGEPSRFDAESFYSADPQAPDRSYTKESGFITDFRPGPELRAEWDTLPSREATTLWLRHALRTALASVTRRERDRFFAAFGFTADGSQELEEQLVLSGYLRRAGSALSSAARERLRGHYTHSDTPPSEFLPHRIGRNAIAGLLPERTELVMVDAACSSSLYGLDLAVKALREGEATIAVCGGAFGYSARNVVLFSKLSGLSKTGQVRCFDRDASGVLFSDGAGVLILKRLKQARADGDRVLGVIDGIGLACDGKGKAIYAPNHVGQELALRRAYADGNVDPASVSWVIAHATGTQAGDSTELSSLSEVLGTGAPTALSSNKAIVGHSGWAAGTVSMVQALSGLERNAVPAQRYLDHPMPQLVGSRFAPPTEHTALVGDRPRRVGVNAFGFGGTDAHVIVGDHLPETPERRPRNGIDGDDIVVVGWACDLPGNPDGERVRAWLRTGERAPEAGFGLDYPLPGFEVAPMPPATLRGMDRTQIMMLNVAARLPEPIRDACARLRATTGVVVGHMGPTLRGVHYGLRCYLGDLEQTLREPVPEQLTEQVRDLVPSSTEDSYPGLMPNIIAARLASLWDVHGLNLTVDTGPDAALDALRTAERHLRHGTLDLALVGAVNGNGSPELADILASGDEYRGLAEGAFLVALTRKSTARAEGLPVLATISTELAVSDPASRPDTVAPLRGSQRTYLAGDAMLALLAHLTRGSRTARVGSTTNWGVQLKVSMPVGAEDEDDTPVRRVVRELVESAPRRARAALPAVPSGSVLLVSDRALLANLPGGQVDSLVAPPSPAGPLPDPAELTALLPDSEPVHIRIIADLAASRTAVDDLAAVHRLRVLHDLTFLAAQRWQPESGGSFGVLLLDAVRDGVVHPAAAPFTGLVKCLAREAPIAVCFAVLTESGDLGEGLGLLAAESGRHQDLAVSVHSHGRRFSYRLTDQPPTRTADEPLGPADVVVATGGARGITAEILAALAESAAPTVYLLSTTSPASDPRLESKAAFLAAQHADRPTASMGELAADYARHRAAVETRATMDRLQTTCGAGKVHHLVCDVTDAAAVQAAMDRVHARHDRVDLLVNAAGTHHGATVRATTLEQVRRVRDTKLLGYLNLRRSFAGRPPRRWRNIGSLLAVIGWAGEVDYCSGNELLNTTAQWTARFGPTAETTLAMPLWAETGFAAERVTRELLRRQAALTPVSNRQGRALFLADLGSTAHREITYLGSAERELLARDAAGATTAAAAGPLPADHWLLEPDGARAFRFQPDLLGRDSHLRHHLLFGRPVVPAAMIGALVVEAIARHAPVHPGSAWILTQLTIHRPVHAEHRDAYRVVVDVDDTGSTVRVRIVSELPPDARGRSHRELLHAEATIGTQPLSAAEIRPNGRGRASRETRHPGRRYVRPPWYQPGGPLTLSGPYMSLAEVSLADGAATATFAPGDDPGPHWPILLADALIQLQVIALHGAEQIRAVPEGIARLEPVSLLGSPRGAAISARVLVADRTGAEAYDPDGRPLLRLTGLSTHPLRTGPLPDRIAAAAVLAGELP
ncbi:SDR family oxidoreductase [Nocardia sp. NPDC051570]|uniref:SDR family oxidoreductase n=1 Tax=Nocardia sp. NPDC051570 TaxID=3364324 RepID=UPI0037AAB14A